MDCQDVALWTLCSYLLFRPEIWLGRHLEHISSSIQKRWKEEDENKK
jgi:hypothetical protein